jgi:class 3 adenylate cyclase
VVATGSANSFKLDELLVDIDDHIEAELASMPEVKDVDAEGLDAEDLPTSPPWARIEEIIAVVADLKASTKLSTGKRAASTASIYEASVKPLVDVFVEFDADYIDIQGDCAIGIFWTGNSLERAFCAGVTVKTFSSRFLTPKLEEKWKDAPSTGFKVGMAASRVLVKRVGRPRTDFTEPVWAGKAVNYAAKAAQSVDASEMLVTGTVWERLESNDYIAYTCGCGGPPSDSLWKEGEIEKLPEDEPDRFGRTLTSQWCTTHGEEFCNAILDGKTTRPELKESARNARHLRLVKSVVEEKRRRAKQLRRARGA